PEGYPPELAAIVMRALAKDRRDRQPTALALQDELAAFASAQRLDLSQLALGRWMAATFAAELAAWHDAQRAGQSLVEHVIKRTTTTAAIISESAVGTAQTAAPTTSKPTSNERPPPRARRLPWLVGLAAVAVAAAGGLAALVV